MQTSLSRENNTLSSLTREGLFLANAKNRLLVSRAMSYSPKAIEVANEYCEILLSGTPHPVCNGVFRARFPEASGEKHLDDVLQLFAKHQLPGLFWVEEDASPKNLGQLLLSRGLPIAMQMKDAAADLKGFPLPPLPSIEMKIVNGEAEYEVWSTLFAESFSLPQVVRDHVRNVLGSPSLPSCIENYLVSVNGKDIATVTLCFYQGVVGLYNVTVTPAFRGKDFAQAMLGKTIERILAKGYRYAVGAAVEDLLPFYNKAPLTVLGTTNLFAIG